MGSKYWKGGDVDQDHANSDTIEGYMRVNQAFPCGVALMNWKSRTNAILHVQIVII